MLGHKKLEGQLQIEKVQVAIGWIRDGSCEGFGTVRRRAADSPCSQPPQPPDHSNRPSVRPPQAYVLYRLGRLQDALKAAAAAGDERRSEALQLQAQLHYRLGDAAACIACYDELTKEFKVGGCVAVGGDGDGCARCIRWLICEGSWRVCGVDGVLAVAACCIRWLVRV